MSRILSGTAAAHAPEEELKELWLRLEQALSAVDPWDDDQVREITTALTDAAHLLVHLEGNRRHVDPSSLLPWRDHLRVDRALAERLVQALLRARVTDPRIEEVRSTYVRRLERVAEGSAALDTCGDEVQASLLTIDARVRDERRTLLLRLGIDAGTAPEPVFQRVLARTDDPRVRSKLVRAWRIPRDRATAERTAAVDRLIRARWRNAAAAGIDSPLESTLATSGLTEQDVREFTGEYLARALEAGARLAERVRETTGAEGSPLADLGRYLKISAGERALPLFPVEGVLRYAFDILAGLGFSVDPVPEGPSDGVTVALRRGDDGHLPVGHLRFDLWPLSGRGDGDPHERSTGADGRFPLTGHVLCRIRRDGDEAAMTFDAVHSLLHEIGHALDHLLTGSGSPDLSGMDRLPPERVEGLSMWWEKWAYHPALEHALDLPPDQREGLAVCRRIKAAEFARSDIDRAVIAAVDLEAHTRTPTGLADAYWRVDAAFGVADLCDLADLPDYYSWPVFRTLPGAGFLYLWGSADSARRFGDLRGRGPDALKPDDAPWPVGAGLGGTRPDIDSVSAFYGLKDL